MLIHLPFKEVKIKKKKNVSILDRFKGKKKVTKVDHEEIETHRNEIINTTGYFDQYGEVQPVQSTFQNIIKTLGVHEYGPSLNENIDLVTKLM